MPGKAASNRLHQYLVIEPALMILRVGTESASRPAHSIICIIRPSLISRARLSKARNNLRPPNRVPLSVPSPDLPFSSFRATSSPPPLLLSPRLAGAASMFSGYRAAISSTRAAHFQPSSHAFLRPSSTPALPRHPFSRAMSATTARPDPFRPAARVAGQRQDVWCAGTRILL